MRLLACLQIPTIYWTDRRIASVNSLMMYGRQECIMLSY